MSLDLDARQTAMLAEMGVWLPPPPKASRAVSVNTQARVVRSAAMPMAAANQALPRPPLAKPPVVKLPVREAGPSSLDIAAPTYYRIKNLSVDLLAGIAASIAQGVPAPYKLVVVGEPSSGEARQLLDAMLKPLGLMPAQVFVAELESTREQPYAEHATTQIAGLQAACVLALGPHAVKAMLQAAPGATSDFAQAPFSKLREATLLLANPSSTSGAVTSLVATFHPQQLLRTPSAKARTWQDLKRVRDMLSISLQFNK